RKGWRDAAAGLASGAPVGGRGVPGAWSAGARDRSARGDCQFRVRPPLPHAHRPFDGDDVALGDATAAEDDRRGPRPVEAEPRRMAELAPLHRAEDPGPRDVDVEGRDDGAEAVDLDVGGSLADAAAAVGDDRDLEVGPAGDLGGRLDPDRVAVVVDDAEDAAALLLLRRRLVR